MTVTRSQTGKTPKKTQQDVYLETPSRRITRSRSSATPEVSAELAESLEKPKMSSPRKRASAKQVEESTLKPSVEVEVSASAAANGANGAHEKRDDGAQTEDHKVTDHIEFGGTPGVTAMMIGFPCLMYYMWIGATYYDGALPTPSEGQPTTDFLLHLVNLVYTGAFPSLKAWTIYWGFFIFEALAYMYLPGITVKGRPLEHLGGKQLTYYCSAVWSFYTTIVLAVVLHVTGVFKLYTIMDEFGPIMSVAIITGFVISIIAYFSAIARGAQHRVTGYPIYDFFMGAELNPRLFGILDFKMFFEVRLPWYILLLVSMGAAARQYELYGYVSGEVGFILMAHFLYANACSKGEELIIPTWDIYYEKWGFMLIFWNLAGVPLSYCHCTVFLANRHPSTYAWNKYALAFLYIAYLFVYWVWDTTNSQKNRFRQQSRGHAVIRKTFPQLPWQTVKNPKTITSKKGDTILADGWYGYARKIHYTCDLYFAINWGLITGFTSPFPWFYPVFFAAMITHRATRDIQRCRAKYGEAWTEYEKQVPYLFIPVSLPFMDLALTGRELD
ncbi:C-24(28) sterol reductase [Microsporum audouinii]